MKLRHALLVSFAVLPAAASAQPISGPYVGLGGGGDILQNQEVKPYEGFGPLRKDYTFHPGVAGEAGVGYGLGNGLRLELNGDYAYAHVRGAKADIPLRGGGHEQQYGGFLDAIYDFDLNLPVTPYLGAGAGAQALELDYINSSQYGRATRNIAPETKTTFGYQGIAGLSIPLFIPGLSLTAEYRFVGMIDPQPFVRGPATTVRNGQVLQDRGTFKDIFNHEALIGIRYAFGRPPAAPPPAEATSAQAMAPAPEPSRTYLVFFDWDRADLTARARQIVAEAAQASTHVRTTRIDVNGYTDLSGTAAYNQRLSVRRAQSVEAELVRDGVNRSEISIHGFGESSPLVQTAQGVREPQNRRVEIILK